MKAYKILVSFISLVCVLALLVSSLTVFVGAVDGKSVTATTSTSIMQGSSGTLSVYIDSTEGLAALDVTVHFDSSKIKVNSVYNSVSCTLYDNATNTDSVQFSYILDGKGSTSKTRLFYFTYQVLSGAEAGDTYFDVSVGEAYDSALNDVAVAGSRCKLLVTEKVTSKTCSVSSTAANVSTSVKKEFTLNYSFSTYQIASGTAVITYDPELFEVVSINAGGFLTDKIADINTDLNGEIYISFVSTKYNTKRDIVSVTFKTVANTADSSDIKFATPELVDIDLNNITCSGYTTAVTIAYDDSFVENAPLMSMSGSHSYSDKQVTLEIYLEENSHLGAGDFVVGFDPQKVAFKSCEAGFAPNFFNIDDKNVDEGVLKFHIISLEDIVTSEKVLTVTFDVVYPYNYEKLDFSLEGSDFTDSLTEKIQLNLIGCSVMLDYLVEFYDYDGSVLQSAFYNYGDQVVAPVAPARPDDGAYKYTFIGWDKEVSNCLGDAVYTAVYERTLLAPTTVSSQVYTVSENIISNVAPGSTVGEMLSNLHDNTLLSVYKGGELANADDKVATGMVVKITYNGLVTATYTVAVKGDINGDGFISSGDMLAVKLYASNRTTLTEVQSAAADYNGDGAVTQDDFLLITALMLGNK